MALIKCGECGKEISDRAAACPGCGAPIAAPAAQAAPSAPPQTNSKVRVERAGFRWELAGFVVILVAIVVGIAGGGVGVAFAGVLGFAGFVVFMIGRFID